MEIDLELLEASLFAYGNAAKNKGGEIVFIYGIDYDEIFNLCFYLAKEFPDNSSEYIRFVKDNIYHDSYGHMVINVKKGK